MYANDSAPKTLFRKIRRLLAGEVTGTLAVVLLLAVAAAALWWNSARKQAALIATIRSWGGRAIYSCDMPFASTTWPPRWLLRWLGKDFCCYVVDVDLSGKQIDDADVAALASLKSLRYLSLGNTVIGDAGVAQLTGLSQLEEITLRGTNITDRALESLKQCKKLRLIYLERTKVTDEGVMQLADLPDLYAIFAVNTRLTAEGVELFHEAAPSVIVQNEIRRRRRLTVRP